MAFEPIFQPLKFRNLTVKNRIFRSNIAGRFDNYDGSGNQARINFELKFARRGVGAILSSYCSVQIRGICSCTMSLSLKSASAEWTCGCGSTNGTCTAGSAGSSAG